MDLGLFFELAEEGEVVYKHTPVKTLMEGMGVLRKSFFENGVFILGEERKIDTNRFFSS